MTVNTRKIADRRTLKFNSLEDVWSDVEGLGDSPRAIGNWTPAQIVWHVSHIMNIAYDGAGFKAPLPLRIVGRLLKKRSLAKTMGAGLKLPARFNSLLPDPNLTWDEARDHLRRNMERIRAGEKMSQPSPFLGPMTHEDWVRLHCRHAELHLSFIQPA